MININIICIGTLKEAYLKSAVAEYSKRMNGLCKFSITELDEERVCENPSPAQIDTVLKKEGERIIKKIPAGSAVVPMCIEGKQLSSEQLSEMIEHDAVDGISCICFIIGGSYGLSEDVKNMAKLRLSMSKMTFPHQLARVMLTEQIYRALKISSGGKYHK